MLQFSSKHHQRPLCDFLEGRRGGGQRIKNSILNFATRSEAPEAALLAEGTVSFPLVFHGKVFQDMLQKNVEETTELTEMEEISPCVHLIKFYLEANLQVRTTH